MLSQLRNNWARKIERTAKNWTSSIWQSEEFFESNYFLIGQHGVLLPC